MLLLDTGLRCAELTSCKLGDVHIDRGYLKVMGKGARERMVPIGVTVRKGSR
jgi:integrase/recombinase XerD